MGLQIARGVYCTKSLTTVVSGSASSRFMSSVGTKEVVWVTVRWSFIKPRRKFKIELDW